MRTVTAFSRHHDGHYQTNHAERPERLHAIEDLLSKGTSPSAFIKLHPRQATLEEVVLVHPSSYYERLVHAVEAGGAQLDPDTYTTPDSLHVALEALGGLLEVTRSVLSGDADNGFAIVRPPGHHARPDTAMGFCLFANIAIAARYAQQKFGLRKILIVDFDVHHGNGTQEIFYEDPDVMYMSTHQWPLYPGTGALSETGHGPGEGTTVNIPMPAASGDEAYRHVFEHILRPIALDFQPEVIFVSAGYDAHWMDPLAGMQLTVSGFAQIVRELLSWGRQCCGDRLIALLEGGYNTDALAHSVRETLNLLQQPDASITDALGKSPMPDADVAAVLADIAAYHAQR